MPSYKIHRLKDHLRQHFRHAPHVSGAASVKPRDYNPGDAVEAKSPYAWRVAHVAVKIGMVVLFPSWLRHSVVPVKSGRRVSIAFNCVPRDGLGSVPDGYGLPFAKFADAPQGR